MYTYFIIPCVTGFIGWVTNWIAVKMLFFPRRPIKIFGLKLHGVIPARQEVLARSLGVMFGRELLTKGELSKRLGDLPLETELAPMVEERLTAFLDGMKAKHPMIGMFLNDAMVGKMKSELGQELLKAAPELKKRLFSHVGQKMDLQLLVEEKIGTMSVVNLEKIVLRVATKELRAIEILGGVLGLLIGLAQVGLMILLK